MVVGRGRGGGARPVAVGPLLVSLARQVLLPGQGLLVSDVSDTTPKNRIVLARLAEGDEVVVAVKSSGTLVATPLLHDLFPVAVHARVMRNPETSALALFGLKRVLPREILRTDPILQLSTVDAPDTDTVQGAALWAEVRDCLTVIEVVHRHVPAAAVQVLLRRMKEGMGADQLRDVVDALLVLPYINFDVDFRIACLCERSLRRRIEMMSRKLRPSMARPEVARAGAGQPPVDAGRLVAPPVARGAPGPTAGAAGAAADALPPFVVEAIERAKRAARDSGQAPAEEYIRLLKRLPWNKLAPTNVDLGRLAEALDREHIGLGDAKQPILEKVAVLKLGGRSQGIAMCLVGPPGVGKTSVANAIAVALQRPMVRVALGGVDDETEIRGFSRTYQAASPGRIVRAFADAGVVNPVILLDEIDKLGATQRGSPAAALLEVLDTEQNGAFRDRYVEIPLDLSKVLFIATANDASAIRPELRSRLEMVTLRGYFPDEKVRILREKLIPRAARDAGLQPGQLIVADGAVEAMVAGWSHEAGVRDIAQLAEKLARSAAVQVSMSQQPHAARVAVDVADLEKRIGTAPAGPTLAETKPRVGVCTLLFATPTGGGIGFVEVSKSPGAGEVRVTGFAERVLAESARAALAYLATQSAELGFDADELRRSTVHIHFAEGAQPKDGPSAGVAIFATLASVFTGIEIRADTAITGECSLRGRVLAVGGIAAKAIGAERAGIQRLILPRENEGEWNREVPERIRTKLEVHFIDEMDEALPLLFVRQPQATHPERPRPARTIGGYQLHEKLGSGGMAEVYVGAKTGPGGFVKRVAIKQMRTELAEESGFRDMFLDEARLAARLAHPNIVSIYELGEDAGVLFLVMELCPGLALSTLRRSYPILDPDLVVALGAQLLAGLHYAHTLKDEQGRPLSIVHRDISPQNVMVDGDGVLHVLDFGIARAAGKSSRTRTGTVKGKLAYMAPEQLDGTEDARADVFAVGVILCELLCGQRHVDGDDVKIMKQLMRADFAPPSALADVPDALRSVVLQALHPEPAQRFASAAAMRAALLASMSNVGVEDARLRLGELVRAASETKRAPGPDTSTTDVDAELKAEDDSELPNRS